MEAVHYFVWGLFRGMQDTVELREQCEELESHIHDRIADSMKSGISEKEAFAHAVSSLGDLSELIDTMTGEKKKILIKKLDWILTGIGLVYGTLYVLAMGVWFFFHGFGFFAGAVVLPAWLGFVIPAIIRFVDYRRNPKALGLVKLTPYSEIKPAFIGWFVISLSCWIVNVLLIGSDTFLSVIWAWMPMVGVIIWPMSELLKLWLINNDQSLLGDEA